MLSKPLKSQNLLQVRQPVMMEVTVHNRRMKRNRTDRIFKNYRSRTCRDNEKVIAAAFLKCIQQTFYLSFFLKFFSLPHAVIQFLFELFYDSFFGSSGLFNLKVLRQESMVLKGREDMRQSSSGRESNLRQPHWGLSPPYVGCALPLHPILWFLSSGSTQASMRLVRMPFLT